MPVEIRELIIRTDVRSSGLSQEKVVPKEDLRLFKKQILEECKRMISGYAKRKNSKR